MRRFFRLVFKLGLLAAIGIGIALAVKKLTAPPPLPDELEPWPPLTPEPATSTGDDLAPESANGSASESEETSASSN